MQDRRAYLNFGRTSITVMFTERDRILFLKEIAGGGRQLDQEVAQHQDLKFSEAAEMRRGAIASAKHDPDNEIRIAIIEAIRHPLEAVAAEIELCLRYYKVTFRGQPIDEIIVTGSEAIRWIVEFFSARLRTGCVLPDPFAALAQQPRSKAALESPWRFTTVIGLSLRGLDEGKGEKSV